MSTITIKDLPKNSALDCKAMSSIKGAGGASWVFSVAHPYARAAQSDTTGMHLYQITNNFYDFSSNIHVDQMINKYQIVNIDNSGAGSTGNAVLLSSIAAA